MKALLQYDVVDGPIRETHRWAIPGETTVADILAHVDCWGEGGAHIDRETVRILWITETDEF